MALPAQLTVVTVHGRYLKPDGTPDTGTVTFAPTVQALQVPADNSIVTPTRVEKTLDSNGEFTTTLIATDDPDATPSGWTYQVAERTSTLVRHRLITVPAATVGTLELADIADAVPGPANVAYALAAAAVLKAGGNLATLATEITNGFLRVDLTYTADADTPDALAMYYQGVRTGYFNEKGEVRARPAAASSTPLRVQQHSAAQSANLQEWTKADNTALGGTGTYIGPDGALRAWNIDPAAWAEFVYEVGATDVPQSGIGMDTARGRVESTQSGVVRLRGAIGITGAGFAASATCATLPLALRPTVARAGICRISNNATTQARWLIGTDGTVKINAILSAGADVHLDGITFTL